MKAWERRCKQCEKLINNNSHDNTKEITIIPEVLNQIKICVYLHKL